MRAVSEPNTNSSIAGASPTEARSPLPSDRRDSFREERISPPSSSEGPSIDDLRRSFRAETGISDRRISDNPTFNRNNPMVAASFGVVYVPRGEVIETLQTAIGENGKLNIRSTLPDSPERREAAAIMTKEVAFMDRFIAPGKLLDLHIKDGIEGSLNLHHPYISVGMAYHTENKVFDLTTRHELAHAVYGVINGDYGWSAPPHMTPTQQADFGRSFEGLFKQATALAAGVEPREAPIWKAFTESRYVELKSGTFGHPFDAGSELFASASTILLTPRLQEQFISKVSALEPNEQKVAKDIARMVVSFYSEHPQGSPELFSPKLREFLQK